MPDTVYHGDETRGPAPLLADFLDPDETAQELNITRRTLDHWHSLRTGPPRTRIGRRVYYKRSTLRAWVAAQERVEVRG